MSKARICFALAMLAASVLMLFSGQVLVVNEPRKSDVIVVLAGEADVRPSRGLELLAEGYAKRLILDVPVGQFYGWNQVELAKEFARGLPQAASIMICPISALSTKTEAQEVGGCLQQTGGHDVLLVTSDYHTRRALSTFRRVLPAYTFGVSAAVDPREFGVQWWRHREWAKTNTDEWLRLIWWDLVDRWL